MLVVYDVKQWINFVDKYNRSNEIRNLWFGDDF